MIEGCRPREILNMYGSHRAFSTISPARLLVGSLAVLLVFAPARAQETASATKALASAISRNGVYRTYLEGKESEKRRVARPVSACTLQISRIDEFEGFPGVPNSGFTAVDTILLPLASLDPEVRVTGGTEPAGVAYRTSTGLEEISVRSTVCDDGVACGHRRHGESSSTTQNQLELPFHGATATRAVAAASRAAILACGGTEPSDAVAAQYAHEEQRQEGNDEEGLNVKRQCRQLVLQELPAHDTVRFPQMQDWWYSIQENSDGSFRAVSSWVRIQRDGNRTEFRFGCRFERIGDSWVPAQPPLLSRR